MLGWCQRASRFRRALTLANPWTVDVLILVAPISAHGPNASREVTIPDSRDCPDVRFVSADLELLQLIRDCIGKDKHHPDGSGGQRLHKGFNTGMPSGLLFKWQLMSWTDYDAVFLAVSAAFSMGANGGSRAVLVC